MRNRPLSETLLLREAVAGLSERLPKSWSLSSEPTLESSASAGVDATLSIRGPDGSKVIIVVEIKNTIDARDVPRLASQLRLAQAALPVPNSAILIAPFISDRTRSVLEDEAIGYVDSTGNVRLQIEQPALFVRTTGAESSPWKQEARPLRSLRGPSSGRAVRSLIDFRPPYGIRELANLSGTPAPTLSRVAELLSRDALLVRDGSRGKILELDWRGVIRRWAQDYSFARANNTDSYIAPRGLRSILQRLPTLATPYAITGSIAASELNPIAEARAATIFVDNLESAAAELDLKPVDAGANVVLAEPFDGVVFQRTRVSKGLTYVAASQLAVDLLTGPGRGPSEGEAVLRWMSENESQWRV